MTLVATCQCGQSFAAIPQLAGKTVPCPLCGRALTVPSQAPAPPPSGPLDPLAADPFVVPNPALYGANPQTASRGLPAYQPPKSAAGGGFPLSMPLLIGGAVGGGLLAICVVAVLAFAFLGNSGKKPIASAGPPSGPPPGFSSPPHGFGPPAGFPSHSPGFPSQPQGFPSQPRSFPSGHPAPPAWPDSTSTPRSRSPFANSSSSSSPSSSTSTGGTVPGFAARTKPYSVEGKFSMSVPSDFNVTETLEETRSGKPSYTVKGDRGGGRGILSIRVLEQPNAPNDFRKGAIIGLKDDLVRLEQSSGMSLVEVKGLEPSGKIPDVVDFSFILGEGLNRNLGGGRIIFGRKRIGLMFYSSLSAGDIQLFKNCIQTFQEI